MKIDTDIIGQSTSTTPSFHMRRRPCPAKHRGERYRSRGVKAPSRCMARIIARIARAIFPGITSPDRSWYYFAPIESKTPPDALMQAEGRRMMEQLAVYRVPDYRYSVRISNL